MRTISFILLQNLSLVLAAPLLSGLIRVFKNNLRMRRGAPLLQPYYNLAKLFRKEEVVSTRASFIFTVTPWIVLASTLTAAFLLPVFGSPLSLNSMGDFFVLVFLLALARFFISLAGLDTASPFSGMGSSREMFISSLAEPVALISIFTVCLNAGSTGLAVLTGPHAFRLSTAIAGLSFFAVMLAETSRIPVDNQETHLELTMIHEAMVLEYSGRSLAMIELASHVKQIVFFTILANVFLPFVPVSGSGPGLIAPILAVYLAKILLIAAVVSLVEIAVAKMRLFRAVDYLAFALFLAVASLVASAIGA